MNRVTPKIPIIFLQICVYALSDFVRGRLEIFMCLAALSASGRDVIAFFII